MSLPGSGYDGMALDLCTQATMRREDRMRRLSKKLRCDPDRGVLTAMHEPSVAVPAAMHGSLVWQCLHSHAWEPSVAVPAALGTQSSTRMSGLE